MKFTTERDSYLGKWKEQIQSDIELNDATDETDALKENSINYRANAQCQSAPLALFLLLQVLLT